MEIAVSIVYRLGMFGPETFRRFGAFQAREILAHIESLRPGALVGLALSPRAETCRPGRPRGDDGPTVEDCPLIEGEYIGAYLQAFRALKEEQEVIL